MLFPGRELKPYAEPVSENALVPGQVYFAVQFLDPEMHVPALEPVVFLGHDSQQPGPGKRFLFQDAESHRAGVPQGAPSAMLYSQPEGHCKHLFEFEQALDVLLGCSLRRASRA